MSYQEILVATSENVTTITLNRPKQYNSFTRILCAEVYDALMHADTDSAVRCILLTGAGKAFCAGQDLKEIEIDGDNPTDLGVILEDQINPIIRKIYECHTPVVCAVNGIAAGAGANLALVCDMVIAKKSAKFIQAFRHVGLIPDAGGTWLLTRLIGRSRAMGMALIGESVSADQAKEWGLIWDSIDDKNFLPQIDKITNTIANGPTLALGMTKKAIHEGLKNCFHEQLNLERDFQASLVASDEYKEGVNAFIQKRPPDFISKQ